MVKKLDKNSIQLAESIYQGANIVITNLQKFSFVVKKIADMEKSSGKSEKRTYACIVDEAHSSQGGEASKTMKEVLSGKTLEEADDIEYEIRKTMLLRGINWNLTNISTKRGTIISKHLWPFQVL